MNNIFVRETARGSQNPTATNNFVLIRVTLRAPERPRHHELLTTYSTYRD